MLEKLSLKKVTLEQEWKKPCFFGQASNYFEFESFFLNRGFRYIIWIVNFLFWNLAAALVEV